MIKSSDTYKHFVIDKCARTANVQVKDPDTTATYFGAGEMVITDKAGTTLTTSTALKSVEAIVLWLRNKDGSVAYRAELAGKDITYYGVEKYKAYTPLTTYVEVTDFAKTNHEYLLEIVDEGLVSETPCVSPISVVTGDTAYTKVQLIDAFVAAINLRHKTVNRDQTIPRLTASNYDDTHIKIVAEEYTSWDALTRPRVVPRFNVLAVNGWGTVTSNKYAALTSPEAVALFHEGTGLGKQIAEVEVLATQQDNFTKMNYMGFPMARNYNYDAAETYDVVKINLTSRLDKRSVGVVEGKKQISIAIPVTSNDSAQAADIIAVLNKYINNQWGVGSAITLS